MGGCPRISLTTTTSLLPLFSPEKVSLSMGGPKGQVRGTQQRQGCLHRGSLQAGWSVEAWFGTSTCGLLVPAHGDESGVCGHLDSSGVNLECQTP